MNDTRTPYGSMINTSRIGDLQRGWLLVNAGVLLVLWGVSWLVWGIYSYFDTPAEFTPNQMMLSANLFGQPGILFGLLAFIYGMRSIKPPSGSQGQMTEITEDDDSNLPIRGWLMAFSGGLISFWGVFFLVLMIYNLVILRGTPDANTDIFQQAMCFLPGMIVGIPLMLSGSRMIIYREG